MGKKEFDCLIYSFNYRWCLLQHLFSIFTSIHDLFAIFTFYFTFHFTTNFYLACLFLLILVTLSIFSKWFSSLVSIEPYCVQLSLCLIDFASLMNVLAGTMFFASFRCTLWSLTQLKTVFSSFPPTSWFSAVS